MKSTKHLFGIALAAASLGWIAPAAADVALTTTAQKIEKFTAPDGAVATRLIPAQKVLPGDDVRYTITFVNGGDKPVDAGTVVVTNPVPEHTHYIADSAFGSGTTITYSVDGGRTFHPAADLMVVRDGVKVPATAEDYTTIRWKFAPALAPAAQSFVSFNVRLD